MMDWSSEHRDVVGYWAHVGPTEVEWDFFGEYIPYNLQGDYKKISKTTADDYWRFYLPKTKEKVLYSRQLMKDLRQDPLLDFDVHHLGPRCRNCLADLAVDLSDDHRRRHGREGGLRNRGRGLGLGGRTLKPFR